jgi:hypothetical protein
MQWRFVGQPAFGNVLATIDLADRQAIARIETAEPGPELRLRMEAELS